MICLDTNVAVVVMNATALAVSERLLVEADRGIVLLPTIVVFELRFGIANSANPRENAQARHLPRIGADDPDRLRRR